MSNDTEELIQICEQLPHSKRMAVVDFARFLLSHHGDEQWEQILTGATARPKLDAFLKTSRAEKSEPMDLDRLPQ